MRVKWTQRIQRKSIRHVPTMCTIRWAARWLKVAAGKTKGKRIHSVRNCLVDFYKHFLIKSRLRCKINSR